MMIRLVLLALLCSKTGLASSLTVRDIKLQGDGKVEIFLDGIAPKSTLEMEFVRDIVQFSIQNATIYPAKILHADASNHEVFSKVFAYQYAPNLVRVRFSVEGKAEAYRNKVKWDQKGKLLTLAFPKGATLVKNSDEDKGEETASDSKEKSLLAKVLGTSDKPAEKPAPKVVEVVEAPKQAKEIKDARETRETKEAAKEASTAVSVSKENAKETSDENNESERLPIHKKTSSEPKTLGGAKNGPSVVRSFLAMMLIVGGLGLVLVYVKRKKGSPQARKVGDSWISNIFTNAKKNKPLIEVVGTHALGPKQSITIVKIRGQQLVLGVAEGNIQLITQLDSDEEMDLLDDPNVADTLGKMFGAKPEVQPVRESRSSVVASAARAAQNQPSAERAQAARASIEAAHSDRDASFNALLKNSNGAGAIVARNAYQAQTQTQPQVQAGSAPALQSSVRDQIKQRLQGMKNV